MTPTPDSRTPAAPSAAETGQQVGREGGEAQNGGEGRVQASPPCRHHHYVARGVSHRVVAWVRICSFCGDIELVDRALTSGSEEEPLTGPCDICGGDWPALEWFEDSAGGGYAFCPEHYRRASTPRIADLIERSSLGTPEAKALRDSVPQELVDRVMARYRAQRHARESQPAEVRDAIEAVAQMVLFNLVDQAEWGDYPEMGESDWQAVVDKARDLATPTDPFAFEAAYALLEARTNDEEN